MTNKIGRKRQKTDREQIRERALGNRTVCPRNTEMFISLKLT